MDTIKTIIWYLIAVAVLLAIPYCLMDGAARTQAERESRIERKIETIRAGESTRINGILVLKVDEGRDK
jgi:inner membrane protein involved in colicin E2 resistance